MAALCRKCEVSDATAYKRKAKYGGMDVSEAKRLKGLEDEKARLKQLIANAMHDNAAMKDRLGRGGNVRRKAASGRASGGGSRDEQTAGVQGHRLLPDDHSV